MAWNTRKLQEIVDKSDRRRPNLDTEEIVSLGSVATRHINFRVVQHFPDEEFGESITRAPVGVPASH